MRLFVEMGGAVASGAAFSPRSAALPRPIPFLTIGGSTRASDGLVTASLYATNKLITGGGALSYSPILTIACRADGEPHWSEWLQLNDAVSASRTITMSVTLDQGSKFDESWSVGTRGRMLVRDGADGIKRLVAANRLLLSWRFGLLSGRGEADFDLAGFGEAVNQIAGTCNTDVP